MRLLSAVKYIISSSELEPGEQKIIDEICSLKGRLLEFSGPISELSDPNLSKRYDNLLSRISEVKSFPIFHTRKQRNIKSNGEGDELQVLGREVRRLIFDINGQRKVLGASNAKIKTRDILEPASGTVLISNADVPKTYFTGGIDLPYIGQLFTRLRNIEARAARGLSVNPEEVKILEEQLKAFDTDFSGELASLTRIIKYSGADKVPSPNTSSLRASQSESQVQENTTPLENTRMIEYINMLLKGPINYDLSSTKTNGHTSFGDGSFVKMILRPLLQNLKAIILLWGDHVDVQNISWKDIITLSEKVMDDRDAARLHFIGLLKKRDLKLHWKRLIPQLIEAIEEFSTTRYYRDSSKVPLRNVIDALKHNLPRS